MARVEIDDVRKAFGTFDVIHGVTMTIEDGEFVILVGPSGCGKSTLLRMIAGLEDISSGRIAIGGRVVNNMPPKDRDIAMVFQNYALYPQMTVAQNLGFSLEIAGLKKAEVRQKVERAAEILGLAPLLGRKPAQLSGGQRQRVAMGRAIVRDPAVFLFDEPLSNLDANLRVQMRAEIKALHRRLESTIVYVTHDQVEAMTMADRIVVLRAGVIEQIGTPLELYDGPANMFVARFLGSPAMNFLTGTVNGEEPTLVLPGGSRIALGANPPAREVVLGVRPQDVVIDEVRGTPARVVVVEPTGADTHILARIDGVDVTCVIAGRTALEPDDVVRLSFASSNAHFFDPTTERRIETRAAGHLAPTAEMRAG